jgi:hypothetical protein
MKGEMGKMEIREMYTKVKLDNWMEKENVGSLGTDWKSHQHGSERNRL